MLVEVWRGSSEELALRSEDGEGLGDGAERHGREAGDWRLLREWRRRVHSGATPMYLHCIRILSSSCVLALHSHYRTRRTHKTDE